MVLELVNISSAERIVQVLFFELCKTLHKVIVINLESKPSTFSFLRNLRNTRNTIFICYYIYVETIAYKNIPTTIEVIQELRNLFRLLIKYFSVGSRLLLPSLLVIHYVSLCSSANIFLKKKIHFRHLSDGSPCRFSDAYSLYPSLTRQLSLSLFRHV